MMDSSRGAERAKERRETGIGMRMAGLGFQTSSEVVAGALLGYLFDWWKLPTITDKDKANVLVVQFRQVQEP